MGSATNDAKIVKKMRNSKEQKMKGNPEKDMLTSNSKKKPSQNGKDVRVLSDSMLQQMFCPKQDILSKSLNKVSVRIYLGGTTEDNKNLRPVMRKKPDMIIIHIGANGLTKDVNTMKYVRSIVNIIEEMNGSNDIQHGFSGIFERRYHDLNEKIKDINERLKKYCQSKGIFS